MITAGNLLDAGISDIWAKSVSKEHARILQRIGARHIINAETDAGKRVGHLVSGNYLDYIEIEGSHTVVKIHTPSHVVGYSIADAKVNERYGVTVVASRRPAASSSTVPRNWSCTATTNSSSWASRTTSTSSFAADRRQAPPPYPRMTTY